MYQNCPGVLKQVLNAQPDAKLFNSLCGTGLLWSQKSFFPSNVNTLWAILPASEITLWYKSLGSIIELNYRGRTFCVLQNKYPNAANKQSL